MTDRSTPKGPEQLLDAAPELTGPVVGFRAWRLTDGGLCSPRVGTVWTTRRLRAECRPQTVTDFVREPHRSPAPDCRCGIGVDLRPDLTSCEVDFRGVVGIVTVWGHLEVGRAGMRAEWAEVQALGAHTRWTRRQKAAVSAEADRLGVDFVDARELQRAALAYAIPLPDVLLPDPEPAGGSARDPRRTTTRPVVVAV